MEDVMKTATVQGLPLEETYPYDPFNSYSGICDANGIHVAE